MSISTIQHRRYGNFEYVWNGLWSLLQYRAYFWVITHTALESMRLYFDALNLLHGQLLWRKLYADTPERKAEVQGISIGGGGTRRDSVRKGEKSSSIGVCESRRLWGARPNLSLAACWALVDRFYAAPDAALLHRRDKLTKPNHRHAN